MLNTMHGLLNQIRRLVRKVVNVFLPTENITESKQKWNSLAKKNASYYIKTDFGEKITEEEFRQSGEKDYKDLIENDQLVKENLGNLKDKIVLEIGCGTGRITEFISKNCKKVIAVDISEEMINEGQERLKNLTNIDFVAGNGLNYPIEDNSVDFVFSYIVFQHMPNKKVVEENLKNAKRVLKEGGIAKIQVRGLPTSKLNWFYGPSFTKREIEKLVKKVGFKILRADGENQRYFWIWLQKN
jgi:SAM-dependent methyltransferase